MNISFTKELYVVEDLYLLVQKELPEKNIQLGCNKVQMVYVESYRIHGAIILLIQILY